MNTAKSGRAWLTGAIFSGHYEVGSLIARGGMSEVYHAVDLWSNNPVAVKVLLPQFSQDASVQQKFFREERSLRQVRHKAVVSVIDSGTEYLNGSDVMFLVLEYVHGCTLHQLLKIRPVFSVAEVFDIMLPIVEGLSEVHALSLIHRDIKPGNVLMSSAEHAVKLADFGLTRRQDQSWTGSLMGTPPYVAPEIVSARGEVGPQSDIFALGVMLYRMLSGRLPFGGMDDQQVLYHNVNTELPSITRYAPGLSQDIVGLIKWCTRKSPSARPENATELFEVMCEIKDALAPAELTYKASIATEAHHDFWLDVAEIAEVSGANQALRHQSITAFGNAKDLLEETEGSPVDLRPYAHTPTDSTPDEDDDEWWDPGVNDESAADKTQVYTVNELRQVPISAEYSPSHRSVGASVTSRPSQPTVTTVAQKASDPRHPLEPYVAPKAPAQIAGIAVALVAAAFLASFLGWWLATELMSTPWWQNLMG